MGIERHNKSRIIDLVLGSLIGIFVDARGCERKR